MKKFIPIFLLLFTVLFSSCTKEKIVEKIVEVEKENQNFLKIESIDLEQIATKEKQTLRVPIEGNVKYSVSSKADWAKVPSSVEAGKSLSIELDENLDSEVRETKITISPEGLSAINVSVRQGGVAPFALISPSYVQIDKDLNFAIKIKTNIEYDLSLPSWIKKSTNTNRAVIRTDEISLIAEETEELRVSQIELKGKSPNANIEEKTVVSQGPDLTQAPSFVVISDTHMKPSDSESDTKIRNTLDYFVGKKPDAIFIVGDVTDYGYESEYQRMVAAVSAKVPETIPVYYTTGNHDLYQDPEANHFKNYFKQEPNQYLEIKGHPFIIVGMNSKSSPYYNSTASTFLAEKLQYAAAKFPNKPIFVMYHVGLTNTVYGTTSSVSGEGWGSSYLQTIVNQYPQVIAFSGHSHFPLGDERSIHQNVFTSVNLGSVTYSEIENGFEGGIHPTNFKEVTEGVYVTPVDNESLKAANSYFKDFKVQRFDTYRKEEIKNPWLIKAPHNGTAFIYKNRTGAIPAFAANATVTIKDITSSGGKLEWSQASSPNDYDKVHHYEISVLDESNKVLSTKKVFSQFYLNSNTPAKLTYDVTGLAHSTSYKIQVVAVNSIYTNKSSPIETAIFKTASYVPDASVVAPIADLFDVNYTNTKAVDYSSSNHNIIAGTGNINYSYNTTLKQYLVTYTSNDQSIHKLNYANNSDFINKFTKSFTFEVFYKNTNTKDEIDIVGALESGGIGIEQASGGSTQLWAYISGGYKKVGSTITNASDYYHMVFTYDGTKLIAYTNGVQIGELLTSGNVVLPSNTAAHWFAIGGDANPSGNAQGSMPGDIVFTRLYSKAVSSDEVYRLHEQIGKRKALQNVDGLKYVLDTTIPTKLISAVGANKITLENLQIEGWNLMRKLSTTDQEMLTFINKVNALNF